MLSGSTLLRHLAQFYCAIYTSPAGVALSSTDSALLAARDVALTSGQDVSVSTAARWLASVGHG